MRALRAGRWLQSSRDQHVTRLGLARASFAPSLLGDVGLLPTRIQASPIVPTGINMDILGLPNEVLGGIVALAVKAAGLD